MNASMKYAPGQTLEVVEPNMGKPVGYQFVVRTAVPREDPEFGAGYYTGDGYPRGIWEAFVRPPRASHSLGVAICHDSE